MVMQMKIIEFTEKISKFGKSTRDKQNLISVGEAYHLWRTLINRYDALNITNILRDFTKDNDLKKVIDDGLKVLLDEIDDLEAYMKEFGIPMPSKPPEHANIAFDVNAITDQTIYREIQSGMQNALQLLMDHFSQAQSSTLRELFRKLIQREMELYDKYFEYGKLKGYLHETPIFRR